MHCIAKYLDEDDTIYTYCVDYNRFGDKVLAMKKFAKTIINNILLDVEKIEIKEFTEPGESAVIPVIEYKKEKQDYVCHIIDNCNIENIIFTANYLGEKIDVILKIAECIIGVVHLGGNNVDALLKKLQLISGLVQESYSISVDEFSKIALDYIDDYDDMTDNDKNDFISILSKYEDLYSEFTVSCDTGLVVDEEYAVKVAGYSAERLCVEYDASLCKAYLALAIMKSNVGEGLKILKNNKKGDCVESI